MQFRIVNCCIWVYNFGLYKCQRIKMLITIPLRALSINKAFQGRRFKTKECKQYCRDVSLFLPKNFKVSGYVWIYYKFYLKNWKRTDGGNLEKSLTDILVQNGIIDDDRYIMKYIIEKFPSKEDRIELVINEYSLEEKTP